jgi:phosphonopyruvate decarboxylase
MIDPAAFVASLRANGIGFVTGVPDSLLADACAALADLCAPGSYVIAANEGAAIGLAIGHALATGRPALVYLQNSGLGNAINPLASMADPAIYGIPMLLMIGWRGEIRADGTQRKDEPQHVTQGRITLPQLELLGIPFQVLDADSDIRARVEAATRQATAESRPVALVVRRGAFTAYRQASVPSAASLTREAAIAAVIAALPAGIPVVSTTGMASRELFELRARSGDGHARDFLTVGGMGHAASIATGIARARPGRKTLCLDGDGAVLMHLGALTESAQQANLIHVALNNAAHDSVGGQPTAATRLDLTAIARSCGYAMVATASDPASVAASLGRMLAHTGSAFLDIACRRGARADLGRPTRTPIQNKRDFMAFLADDR